MVISGEGNLGLATFTGNGTTGPFSYSEPYNQASELVVTVNGITKTLTVDYAVASTGTQDGHNTGANITFTVAPAIDAAIRVTRRTVAQQTLDFSSLNTFDPNAIEPILDTHALMVQDAKQKADEAVTGAVDAAVTASVAASVAASEAAIADELAAAQAAQTAAQAAQTAVEAARDAAQTSESNAATSASNAASSASSASTSETNAANSETAAAAAQAATETALESLNGLTDGVFLSRVLRESPDGNNYSFTTVTGGNYLVNCGNLTLGQKVTANLFATPTNATINRFEVKAETNKEFHLDGGTKEIEGHEGTTAFANIHCYLEVAFDEAKNKWVIYEKERI